VLKKVSPTMSVAKIVRIAAGPNGLGSEEPCNMYRGRERRQRGDVRTSGRWSLENNIWNSLQLVSNAKRGGEWAVEKRAQLIGLIDLDAS